MAVGPISPFRHLDECFGCGAQSPLGLHLSIEADRGRAWCRTRFSAAHLGAPGLVHGGLLVTLLDEVMGSIPLEGGGVRVTSTMDLRFRRPVEIGREVDAEASVSGQDGRRVSIDGVIRYADDGTARVEVSAIYVLLGRPPSDREGRRP